MLCVVQHGRLGLGGCSPEHVDDRAVLGIHSPQDGVCELFPPMTPVRICLVGTYREYGI